MSQAKVFITKKEKQRHRMGASAVCLFMTATLSINPDRSQFFRYETVTLSCAVPGSFSGWALKRNTSSKVFDLCQTGWGRLNGSSCVISGAFMSDSGTYWCESERGECSDAVSFKVETSVVILEAPALPVTVGEQIMLRCSYKERYNGKSTSDFTASFFRNDVFIGARSKGRMTILAVAESDEGRYKCEHPTKGASPPSLLSVRAQSTAVPTTPFVMSLPKMVTTVLLFVLYTAIMVLCVVIYRRRARAVRAAKIRSADQLRVKETQRGRGRGGRAGGGLNSYS